MKKITKIRLGRELFLSWNSNSLVLGRPRSKRHLTVIADGGRLAAHLTDETFQKGHPTRSRHLAGVSFEKLFALLETWKGACVDAFIDGLVPIDAADLEKNGFMLSTYRSTRLAFARTFLKPRLRPTLMFREPSDQELDRLERDFVNALLDPSHLDSLRDQPPGSSAAVYMEEGVVIGSVALYYFPNGASRSDGTVVNPGWYGLLHPEYMQSAQARVLLETAGPTLFSKFDRALRFLGFKPVVSAAEMEDMYRRVADGEKIEDVRVQLREKRAG